MKQLLIATRNKGKVKEFFDLIDNKKIKIFTLEDVGISEDIKEDGKTYAENSKKKALFYAKKSGIPALSDDGGLEISYLNNEPGVRSRRWLGYEASDEDLFNHLYKVATSLPDNNRLAKFITVISYALPTGQVWCERGEVEGVIVKKPYSTVINGLPYRAFFYLPYINKYYFNEMLTQDEVKKYNHRSIALDRLFAKVKYT